MRNQPKYNFLKNSFYAIEGLNDVYKNETSFKIEVVLVVMLSIALWFFPISFISKSILQISLFLPLLVEIINSSIERVVDLVTKDYHELAKKAKDSASAAVFLSIVITLLIWIFVFIYEFII